MRGSGLTFRELAAKDFTAAGLSFGLSSTVAVEQGVEAADLLCVALTKLSTVTDTAS